MAIPQPVPCPVCQQLCHPLPSGRCVSCEVGTLKPVGPVVEAPTLGRKDDSGKPGYHLLPWRALEEVVKVQDHGAKRYGEDNWRQLPNHRKRYFAALCRHAVRWFMGERNDPDSGLHHLAHAACCVLFMLELDLEGPQKETGDS